MGITSSNKQINVSSIDCDGTLKVNCPQYRHGFQML